jgi:cell wall-associated NlpC family hydrolase
LVLLWAISTAAFSQEKIRSESQNEINRDSLLSFAKKYLGTPYRYAGRNSKGFDCSGFVHHVYKKFNVIVPYSCPGISSACQKKIEKVELKKGDLLFFKGSNIKSKAIGHIAIVYEVDEKGTIHMIHSCRRGVILEKFNESSYYKARYLFAKRIL